MEELNNFNKGMQQDISPLNIPKGAYIRADNLRIINDVGSTSISINNIKGNEFNISIPDTTTIQKVDIIDTDIAQTITINGETGAAFNINLGVSGLELKNYIVNDGAYTKYNVEYKVYAGEGYILIVPITGFTLTISFGVGDTGLSLNSSYIPAQTNLEIIGSTTIRDDIYLFTTNNTTKNPGGHSFDTTLATDPSSVGQIWKYTYDKITLTGTLLLIYNNFVDFSTYYAIAPSAALGRYENNITQRIYWTDNYNKIRTLNVADSEALALDVSLLDIVPSVDFDIPILQTISNTSGSTISVGAYQVAYRLKNTGGAVTNYSELSNIVYVVAANEATNTSGNGFKDYIGPAAGTTVNKSITWKIENLDTDFERIEIVVLQRNSINDPPIISSIYDEELDNDSYTFVYDGSQTETPVTLLEFLTLSGNFTHAKTMASKDNRLFVGNVRNQLFDINFDCRAFRAFTASNVSTDIKLTNDTISSDYTLAQAEALAETEDTINDYSDPLKACFFKPNSAIPILGGAGLNVSYEFETVAIAADRTASGQIDFNIADNVGAPWRQTNPRFFGNTDLNLNVVSPTNTLGTSAIQTYPIPVPNLNDGFKYPHINSFFRGYQRNEIYRFGIQFFDKFKNPYFVKWIGDIKFPDFEDANINSFYEDGSVTGITDFRLSFVANKVGYDECFVQSLGIKFTIENLEDISNQISGYSIVRVKRSPEDRTIVAEGYLTPVDGATADGNFYTTSPKTSADGNGVFGNSFPQRGFFVTPEISNLVVPPDTSMTLKIKARLGTANSDVSISTGGAEPYYMYKLYTWNLGTSQADKTLSQITYLGYAGNTVDQASGADVFNYDYGLGGALITESQSIGNGAFYVVMGANVSYPGLGLGKLLCTLERTLSSQYSGNTYSARADNEYINCSHFRPIRTTAVAITDNPTVFGGDTYVNLYDSCRWAKNFGASGRAQAATKYSTTFYFPVESTINTDLRYGTYMNKNFVGGAAYEVELIETYSYNSVYSAETDIKIFKPKPDPFVLNEEFDNRIYASEIKINGELTDNWGIFLANNYWDVEGIYGPINALVVLRDKVYSFQDRAFALISINPRVLITDSNDGIDLQLGTGNVLQRHDYLSTEVGCQHQWGVTKSSYKIFWLDVNTKKFYAYGEGQGVNPNSDIKGMFSWFSNNLLYNINNLDKPVYDDPVIGISGIRCVYDFKYNQAIFTITDSLLKEPQVIKNDYTIVFDENLDCFTSFYSHIPKIYFSDGYKIFSTNPSDLSDIYIHDEGDYGRFYGTLFNSTLKFVSNPHYQYTKVFDNLFWDSQATQFNASFNSYTNFNDDTWNTIRVYNDYQNTDTQTLTLGTNIKREERTWQLQIPRNRVLYIGSNSPNIFNPAELSSPANKSFGERIRDKYIVVELTYNNTNNYLLSTNNVKTIFRVSPR